MMRKYLMTGLVAVAFGGLLSSCSNDIETSGEDSVEFNIVKNYEDAFVTRFGQPAENQTWGFGGVVASTRGVNANGNEWGSTYRVPTQLTDVQKDIVRQYFQQNTPIGYTDPGWTDYFIQQVYKGGTNTTGSLSAEQYRSANNGWVVGSNHMDHLAACNADGSIKDHIYNYNYGTCSTYPNVLNTEGVNYYNVSGNYHPDEIQFMVGSTTAKFGYFNSDGSLGHTEYTGLVSWTTIRDWANGRGLNGDCLDDGWNRSFMGFDFEQVVGDDVYAHNGDGTIRYATYADCPSFDYVWDGEVAIKYGASSQTVYVQKDLMSRFNYTWNNTETITDNADGTKTYVAAQWGGLAIWKGDEDWSTYNKLVIEFSSATPVSSKLEFGVKEYEQWADAGTWKIECDLSNKDLSSVTQIALQSAGDGTKTFTISKIYLEGTKTVSGISQSDQILVDGKPIPMLMDDTNRYCGVNGDIDQNNYRINKPVQLESGQTQDWGCLNYSIIQQKVRDGYLPVINGTMCKWVKVQGGADGYYSDWIVTLTKAEGINTPNPPVDPPTPPTGFVCRIIAEDLTVGENSDFDFNDVVFDVIDGGATLRLRAAGGELDLYVADQEVHDAFNSKYGNISRTTLVNTGWNGTLDYYNYYVDIPSNGSYSTPELANNIPVVVIKKGQPITLEAKRAKVASKVCVGSDYLWCAEREDIDQKYHKADGTKLFQQYVIGNLGDDWVNGNAWYQQK